MPTARRTIAMIHPGGLGDVLLAVPAMVRLRTRFPNHRLVLCTGEQIARLLLSCRIIDAWTSVQGRICADLFAGADSVSGHVQTWLEGCDLAVGWTQDLDGKLNETLKSAGVREVIVRSPFSTAIRATHQRDRFLEAINEAPSDDEGAVLLTVTENLLHLGRTCLDAAGISIGQSLAVIHPGSGSAHKCVAPETLATVVLALQISRPGAGRAPPPVMREPTDRPEGTRSSHRRRGSRTGTPLCRAGLGSHAYGGADGGTYGCSVWADRSCSMGSPWRPSFRGAGRTLPLPIMGRGQPV